MELMKHVEVQKIGRSDIRVCQKLTSKHHYYCPPMLDPVYIQPLSSFPIKNYRTALLFSFYKFIMKFNKRLITEATKKTKKKFF